MTQDDRTYCKRRDYMQRYQREWCKKRRAEYFKGKSCAICGSIENLQLDHVNRETKVSHTIWSWSKARREEEIKKCQILCKQCHKKKTALETRELFTGKPNLKDRKLKPGDATLIRQKLKEGVSTGTLSIQFQINKKSIHLIKIGKLYIEDVIPVVNSTS